MIHQDEPWDLLREAVVEHKGDAVQTRIFHKLTNFFTITYLYGTRWWVVRQHAGCSTTRNCSRLTHFLESQTSTSLAVLMEFRKMGFRSVPRR